jgi:NAD(P)-dependent dehydrogenase (short-subunit alcohol dehydrogenase family)
MIELNLYPSLLAAHLSTKYLASKGLVVFTGAAAVFKEPQPEMIAYSVAKTGVHSLALNLT